MQFKVRCPKCKKVSQHEIPLPPQQAGGLARAKTMTRAERSRNAKKGWKRRRG